MHSGKGGGWRPECGARVNGEEVGFWVWAPRADKVELLLHREDGEEKLPMDSDGELHGASVPRRDASLYQFVLDGRKVRSDPASLHQPKGVHGPSKVVDLDTFRWSDGGWRGVPLGDLVIYELHVGTFTEEGTFDAIGPMLAQLAEMGITALEVMPISQFPGSRNWGYDGAYPFAAQASYGGPEGFATLVDRCHAAGMAVLLDVVYNHFGPEGSYFADFGPYFSQSYRTPWGDALNYDGAGSDHVRRFVIDNALGWIRDFHVDGLRLDAIHGIIDNSPKHVLQQLAEEVEAAEREIGRRVHLIAESDLNDPRVVRGTGECGYGLDAQWADDLHHSVHACLTGERFGYYQDFGRLEDIGKALVDPFVYDGRYSRYRRKTHGASTLGLPGWKFVVFSQNHDQVGNRADGARLSTIAGKGAGLVAAATVLLSPYLPLLFMGEEYGERSPFYFFTDHQDPAVARATTEGRRRELESQGKEFIDPQAESTFDRCKLKHMLRESPEGIETVGYYSKLIALRRDHPALKADRGNSEVRLYPEAGTIAVRRWSSSEELMIVLTMNDSQAEIEGLVGDGGWDLEVSSSSSSPRSIGSGRVTFPGKSASVYRKT